MTPAMHPEPFWWPTFRAARCILILLAIGTTSWFPLGAWCRLHREFILGMLIGSVAELLIVLASRWLWDRVLWMRWFSHQ